MNDSTNNRIAGDECVRLQTLNTPSLKLAGTLHADPGQTLSITAVPEPDCMHRDHGTRSRLVCNRDYTVPHPAGRGCPSCQPTFTSVPRVSVSEEYRPHRAMVAQQLNPALSNLRVGERTRSRCIPWTYCGKVCSFLQIPSLSNYSAF